MAHLAAYLDDWRFTHSAGGAPRRNSTCGTAKSEGLGWAGTGAGWLAGDRRRREKTPASTS